MLELDDESLRGQHGLAVRHPAQLRDEAIAPLAEARHVLARYAQLVGDDGKGKRAGELGLEFHLSPVREGVDQLGRDGFDAGRDGADTPRCKGLVHESAEAFVLRRIGGEHGVDRRVAGLHDLRHLRVGRRCAAAHRHDELVRVGLEVLQHLHDVLVGGHEKETRRGISMDGCVAAQRSIELEGV